MPMSNDWFYDYFINEVKAIRRNSIPKPLTYDYMPEGYPEKNIQTVTLMEEQEVDFSIGTGELVGAYSPVQFVPALGQSTNAKLRVQKQIGFISVIFTS